MKRAPRGLGTGPLAFAANEERVRLPVAGWVVWWNGVYDSAEAAERASAEMTETLMSSDEPVAKTLREEYSPENAARFVGQYLNREGLVGLERITSILVDAHHGVREVSSDGEFWPVEIENVIRVFKSWEQDEQYPFPGEITPRGRYAIREWPELSPSYSWRNLALILDNSEFHDLLDQMAEY